jgi:hypothetical protein
VLNFVDHLIGSGAVQLKDLRAGEQIFPNGQSAEFTDHQRKITLLGIPRLRNEIKRRRQAKVGSICNQRMIALMIIDRRGQCLECDAAEKLAPIFVTCNSPSSELAREARV